ncbi:MAG: hypothetical protein CYPHOPRED_003795 [Cyphobasidiales sp. Tagirdzhanova-0007]|nr:MAG: hypothetical protein CYPHOPRED_003795 [Cyphobasidiales sp. Tagirdzhanova-0007]
MWHSRKRSDGLNVGEGFPTSYSSFAVSADTRGNERRSSASSQSLLNEKAGARKRRSSSIAPVVPLEDKRLQGPRRPSDNKSRAHGSQNRRIGFDDSGKSVNTKKSWETIVREFKRRWIFVLFFVGFSALVLFGGLLPVSRNTAKTVRKLGERVKREGATLARASRFDQPESLNFPIEDVQTNRFARWAAALFGPSGGASQPIILTGGLGDLEMPDFQASVETNWPKTGGQTGDEAVSGRRIGKRRTADEIDKDISEHPSRIARRLKLAASLAEETKKRDQTTAAKRKLLRKRVMERVAKALRGGSSALAAATEVPTDGHVLSTHQAAHPEEIDEDGAFNGISVSDN